MRRAVLIALCAVLLSGPTAVAFFAGGYFTLARAWVGFGTWLVVIVGVALVPRALRFDWGGRLAVAGMAGLAALTLISTSWAPVAGTAWQAGLLAVLYVGALLASAAVFRLSWAIRAAEPALAAGVLIVIGYGLSERFVPGLLHFFASTSAEGRLNQPLTYWNATGELAAIGLLLCCRVAGDVTRPRALRAAAAAASVLIGCGLYCTFSRGALFAYAAGLVALVLIVRRREQFAAAAMTLLAAALGGAAAAPFHCFTALAMPKSTAETQGAIVLGLIVIVTVVAAVGQWWLCERVTGGALRLPAYTGLAATGLIVLIMALAIVVGSSDSSGEQQLGTGAGRLTTVDSARYAYWRTAFKAFDHEPIRGIGAGGWAVEWLQQRQNNGYAQNAHSLPIETLAELGLIGITLLALLHLGVALAARRALLRARALAAGPAAVLVCWFAHSLLDWDWQMPAVTLLAFSMAGIVLALAAEPVAEAGAVTAASVRGTLPVGAT